jgi:hypothetical protein
VEAPGSPELRRIALAVSVLDDVDIVPMDDGVLLPGVIPVEVGWVELRRALGGAAPESDLARARIRGWLVGRRTVADRHPDELRELARPVGLPVDHPLHPGLDWVQQRVMGDALDLGFGFLGVGNDPDEVVVIPQGALDAAEIDLPGWWPDMVDYLERMGGLAGERLSTGAVLRPIGDCDVVTLLGSRLFRLAMSTRDGTGLRAVAVPMRRRGWLDLSRIDPAYVIAAAAATDPLERGFSRPLLLTVDEVTLAPAGGDPAEIVLRDPAAESAHLRPMLFR